MIKLILKRRPILKKWLVLSLQTMIVKVHCSQLFGAKVDKTGIKFNPRGKNQCMQNRFGHGSCLQGGRSTHVDFVQNRPFIEFWS